MVKGEVAMRSAEPIPGEIVEIPWPRNRNVRCRVREVYGSPGFRHAIVELTLEISDDAVADLTTYSLPVSEIIRIPTPV